MVKTIQVEPIQNREKYLGTELLTREEVKKAMDQVVSGVRLNMEYIKDRFPSPAAKNRTYEVIDNIEWTDGFWTGLLWLCYEYTEDEVFRRQAERNVESFLNRWNGGSSLTTTTWGFVFSFLRWRI